MGIPHTTVLQSQLEGISAVDDLADFNKDSLKQLADNLHHPGGCIPDPNPMAVAGATIPMPAFVFGAKSQARLSVACDLVRFYNTVGCDLTAANMHWIQIAKNFETQWKALKSLKDEDDPDDPKITKALPIIKWIEAFLLNPGFHPWAGSLDVTGIPQVNYSTSQRQLTSMQAEVAYLTKVPITTKPVVHTN